MNTPSLVRSIYAYDVRPNFGDEIGPDIVRHVLGVDLPRAKPGDEHVLFSVGSIIHAADNFKSVVVWGSGVEPHYGRPKSANIRFLAVRGPNTAKLVGYTGGVFGDPAILAPRLLPRDPAPDRSGVGIVVHHMTMKRRLRDRVLFDPFRSGYEVIDPRRPWRDVVADIRRCEFVFSQSLHGAILAEAYGVPWAWWKGFHGRLATFKWQDWFASLGAEPRSFRLAQLDKARLDADRRRAILPDADALADALTENTDVLLPA